MAIVLDVSRESEIEKLSADIKKITAELVALKLRADDLAVSMQITAGNSAFYTGVSTLLFDKVTLTEIQ